MKYSTLTIAIVLSFQLAYGQNPNFNLTQVSNVIYPEGCADIWGYVDGDGNEYAIIGTNEATVVLDLIDPSAPNQIYRVEGSTTIWRDMKSWDNYIYSICDNCPDGLIIIDMTDPNNITHKQVTTMLNTVSGNMETLGAFHNIFVDEFGYLYSCGSDLNNGGVVVMDVVTDPWNPVIVGFADARYSHDMYVRDNIIYSSDVYSGFFSIMDATDKTDIRRLATQGTTGDFTHNAWLSDNSDYLFTTDEVDNGALDAYDIRDLNDIKRIDVYQPPSSIGEDVIPHNAHVYNDYVVVSWYTDGVKVIDAQHPDNLVEVASFDTWSGGNGGFSGNWGAYPFLPSGLLLLSDISTGLHVLQPNYERASYLEGHVTDMLSGDNITQVQVDILGERPNLSNSNNFGLYKTGIAEAGSLDVKFSHPFYLDTIVNVPLTGDSLTVLDIRMKPRFEQVNILGLVMDQNGNPLPNTRVDLSNDNVALNYSLVSNGNGELDAVVFDLPYEISSGKWGYGDTLFNITDIPDGPIAISLPGTGENYSDRFIIDQGWLVENNAITGYWERGVPEGTDFQGPLNPGNDSPNDLGDNCYGTGLVGNSPFDNDVDGAFNILGTPKIALQGDETSVSLDFDYWYREVDIGNGFLDSLSVVVVLDDMVVGQALKIDVSDVEWRSAVTTDLLSLFDFWPVVGDLQVAFIIGDGPPSGPIEAAVDNVSIVLERNVATKAEPTQSASIHVYPNPVRDNLTIDLSEYAGTIKSISIYDLSGREVMKNEKVDMVNQLIFDYPQGVYVLQLIDESGKAFTKKLVR